MPANLQDSPALAPGAKRGQSGSHVTKENEPREAKAHDADDPARIPNVVLPWVKRRVVGIRRQQKEGKARHQGERRYLPPPKDTDPRGPERREHQRQNRNDQFARQSGEGEPPRHATRRGDREESADHEKTIRRRVENLADVRNLMKPSSHEAVDPIRRAERAEEPRRDGSMIGAKEEPEKDRQERETNQRDGVGPRQPPCVSVGALIHE